MFSNFIRLGAALSAAVLLASCSSGSGQTETQQSTPEGLFLGSVTAGFTNPTASFTPPANCVQNAIMFVDYAGVFYMFNTQSPLTPSATPAQPVVYSASSGTLSFSAGTMGSSSVLQVVPPNTTQQNTFVKESNGNYVLAPNGVNCGIPITYTNETVGYYPAPLIPAQNATPQSAPDSAVQVGNATTSSTFTGGYNTGQNISGSFTYPLAVDNANDFETVTMGLLPANSSNNYLAYSTDYQNVQNLGTLAGTYTGTVGTSQFSEAATFTFGPASVPANSGNAFGVGLVTGTGASGCVYNGTVSPLFKGNGYTILLNTGNPPCALANTQFAGVVYLYVAGNQVYMFAPNLAHNDGVIFSGIRKQ